jgi:putative flavoprotein involved in K+ transport
MASLVTTVATTAATATTTEVVVIGAGTSGLAVSTHLHRNGVPHIVLEASPSAGGSWKDRWDSFCLNTPNWLNMIGASSEMGSPPRIEDDPRACNWDKDGFLSRDEFVKYLESVADDLPVLFNQRCVSIQQGDSEENNRFAVHCVNHSDSVTSVYHCRFVIIASGATNVPKKVAMAQNIPNSVTSISSNEYMSASQLREGNVLVVGGGNTGAQIVEDILRHPASIDKLVYWATCKNGRFPRRSFGHDSIRFPVDSGFFMQPTASVPKEELHGPQPLLSGVGHRGHTLSIQYLHSLGAIPLGSCRNCDSDGIYFDSNLIAHLSHGDFFCNLMKSLAKSFYEANPNFGVDVTVSDGDEADINDRPFNGDIISERSLLSLNQCAEINELSFRGANIATVVWCVGFVGDFSFVNIPGTLDEYLNPIHTNGVSPVEGLYFNGLNMQRNRLSHLVAGAVQDAHYIVDDILKRR